MLKDIKIADIQRFGVYRIGQIQVLSQPQTEKSASCDVSGRVFAFGEDSHALRLVSKLPDLRAANADLLACDDRSNPGATPATDRKKRIL